MDRKKFFEKLFFILTIFFMAVVLLYFVMVIIKGVDSSILPILSMPMVISFTVYAVLRKK